MRLCLIYKVSGGAEAVSISGSECDEQENVVTVYWPSKLRCVAAIELNSVAIDNRYTNDFIKALHVATKIYDNCKDLRDIDSNTSFSYAQYICRTILNQPTAIIEEHQPIDGWNMFSDDPVESLIIEWCETTITDDC